MKLQKIEEIHNPQTALFATHFGFVSKLDVNTFFPKKTVSQKFQNLCFKIYKTVKF